MLKNYFLLFKPKDIVGGDFYYVNQIGDNIVFAVADCTGHGVSGAFLSMIGLTGLHGIIQHNQIVDPKEILERLRKGFKQTTYQFGEDNLLGINLALCSINTKNNRLTFAGAYNPMFLIRNGALTELPATRNPIGYFLQEKPFENNQIKLVQDDTIYLFSDGFPDQINPEGQKYSKRKFKELLKIISAKKIEEQKEILQKELTDWAKNEMQIDDITVLGLKWGLKGKKH